jgi:hypothetical protein
MVVGALLAIGIDAGVRADAMLKPSELADSRALIYLPTPAQARLLSLGFQQLMADWYWVKGLQYFTDPAQEVKEYRNLGDFLEVVLGLDPDFQYAYKFAGIAIPFDTGRLRFSNTARAIDFLERGSKRFPGNWELHFYLGFYLLNFREDTAGAAEHFAAAARLPGSPEYMKLFAARLFSVSGDLERGRLFAEAMLASTTDANERAKLERRIRDIGMEGKLRQLEEAARRFHDERGRWPMNPMELSLAYNLPPLPPGVTLEDGIARAPEVERMVVHEHPKEDPFRAAP